MGQEQYGRWAAGVDRETAAAALLAFGIVAADDPSLAMTARAGLANELRRVLNAVNQANSGRPRGQEQTVAWIDPLAMANWDPDTVQAGAAQWAEAFRAVNAGDRLTMTVAEASDLVWLVESFRLVSYVTATVAYAARSATPWRFPLRVGFLPEFESRTVHDQLVTSFYGSAWRATLIDPFLLSPARVSCDLLVLAGSPWEAPTRLLALPEVRAGAVLVTGPAVVVPGLDTRLIAKVADIADAWAVGFAGVTNVAPWLVEVVRGLSHSLPFDLAVAQARTPVSVLAADPSVLARETVTLRAMRLAQSLNDLATRDFSRPALPGIWNRASRSLDLAAQLQSIAEVGQFTSEAGDASEIARLEAVAGRVLDSAGGERRLQARISAADQPEVSLTAFRPVTVHAIEVRIGPLGDTEWLATAGAFPEGALEPDRPHQLTVVLTEPRLLSAPQVATIGLPVAGTSTTATFTLTTAPDTTTVDARLIVLSGNRVLQTALLPAEIEGRSSEQPVRRRVACVPEAVIAPTSSALANRRTFGAAFLVNHSADGTRRVTAVADQNAAIVKLDSDTIANALEKLSDRLNDIVGAPGDFGAIDSRASVDLLIFLAFHGADMRTALLKDSNGLDQVLANRAKCVQVVSARPDAYFPFELAYDFAVPDEDAKLCPDAVAALKGDRTCWGPHTSAVVCPTGFWGLSRVIERHAYQPDNEVPDGFLMRSLPTTDRDLIQLGPVLFAASDRVDAVVANSTDSVTRALTAAGKSWNQVGLWKNWRTAAQGPDAPALMLLLPHTAYSALYDAFGLEIGTGDVTYRFDGCLPPEQQPVIVVLLGCETAQFDGLSYQAFPAKFRYAGAEVVIATLTQVLGRHAAPIATKLVHEISQQCAGEACGMGEVMLKLRRHLLAEGLLPVLALASFGDADWLVQA
jgi:hypothetical protein